MIDKPCLAAWWPLASRGRRILAGLWICFPWGGYHVFRNDARPSSMNIVIRKNNSQTVKQTTDSLDFVCSSLDLCMQVWDRVIARRLALVGLDVDLDSSPSFSNIGWGFGCWFVSDVFRGSCILLHVFSW